MFDVHVHAAPDVVPRIGDDAAIAQAYRDAGFEGFVLKSHHEPTVGRAAAATRMSGLTVVGGVALNRGVGGINPAAVAASLHSGGRIVWFPTADAHTHRRPRDCRDSPMSIVVSIGPRWACRPLSMPPRPRSTPSHRCWI